MIGNFRGVPSIGRVSSVVTATHFGRDDRASGPTTQHATPAAIGTASTATIIVIAMDALMFVVTPWRMASSLGRSRLASLSKFQLLATGPLESSDSTGRLHLLLCRHCQP